MQKSIFMKYFSVCASLILVSIGILGTAFMLFASQYFKEDKYDMLQSNLEKAVAVVEENINSDHAIVINQPKSYFDILADAVDAEVFLVGTDGRTVTVRRRTHAGIRPISFRRLL